LNIENIEGLDIEALERQAGAGNLKKRTDLDNPFNLVEANEIKTGLPGD